MSKTENPAAKPPGQFVNEDLARDCARFLDEIKKRTMPAQGFRPESEK
ncbi:MAG TPA: hypothetical protein VHK22_06945 [Gaiellaceae bacterium]|jgi:hypothetical protein|nr:hypothetical protein [Gaiellaceae bacterium]